MKKIFILCFLQTAFIAWSQTPNYIGQPLHSCINNANINDFKSLKNVTKQWMNDNPSSEEQGDMIEELNSFWDKRINSNGNMTAFAQRIKGLSMSAGWNCGATSSMKSNWSAIGPSPR